MSERYGNNPANKIDISIIIVNWNTKDLLRNCLNSIYKTVHSLIFEVIVIDNASSDGSIEMLEKEFASVIRIVNTENKGFGAANNQARTIMKGKYALLLNTDTVLTSEAVNKLWNFCEANDKAAIVCGQLLNAVAPNKTPLLHFPVYLRLPLILRFWNSCSPAGIPVKDNKHTTPIEVDSAIGACMMIREKALDEAGAFDERYFFFFEETDLAFTMRLKGWKIYQVPDALIYHLQGQSIGHNISSRIEFYRSRYQFLRKWHNPLYYCLASGIIILRLLVNGFFNFIFVVLTLGLNKKLRYKLIMYSRLIFWHFQNK